MKCLTGPFYCKITLHYHTKIINIACDIYSTYSANIAYNTTNNTIQKLTFR